jgi:hypothetical protein
MSLSLSVYLLISVFCDKTPSSRLKSTNVSQEHIASIFMVKEQIKEEAP